MPGTRTRWHRGLGSAAATNFWRARAAGAAPALGIALAIALSPPSSRYRVCSLLQSYSLVPLVSGGRRPRASPRIFLRAIRSAHLLRRCLILVDRLVLAAADPGKVALC